MEYDVETLIKAANEVLGEFTLAVDDFYAGSVGAAVKSSSGKIYTGICFDVGCGIGFCAEHSAVAEMLKSRETVIEYVVAVGKSGILPPCGRCRELMMQIDKRNSNTKVVLDNNRIMPLKELLPEHWL
jgi:cytidine deaminase